MPSWEEMKAEAKRIAMQGVEGLGSLVSPPEAEAGLAPEIRKLYQATLAKNKGTMIPKAWYHTSQDPGGLVMAGTKALPEAAAEATVNEHYKPFGLYLSETPQNIPGHLTGTWNMGGTTLSKRFKGIVRPQMQSRGATDVVRAVTAPDSRILSLTEPELQNEYLKFRAQYGPDSRRSVMPINEALEHKIKTEWTKHLQTQADVLHIDGVDGTKDVPEYLHLNPDKLSMFYENKARTPETGVTTAPWARPDLRDSGSVRQRILNRLADKGIVYPETGRPPSTSILKGIGGMNGIEVPEVNWKAKDPEWQAKAQDWFEDSGKLLDAKDKAASKAAKASDMFGEYFGPEEGMVLPTIDLKEPFEQQAAKAYFGILDRDWARMKPNTKLDYVQDMQQYPKWLDDREVQKVSQAFESPEALNHELEKFILGVGAGGLAYAASPGEAQAMPLGKLKPETLMDTVKSSALPRSETALDRALGKKLNLHFGDGDSRKPYEIVDIRKGKDDKRFVIVKDDQGQRHQFPMTSDYLNAMLGSLGTEDYLTSFKAQGLQGKKIQSLKSLGIREAKKSGGSIQNDNVFRDWNSMMAAKAKEIDPALVRDYVYVKNQQNETLYMPKAYADFLASKGHVKILKR